MNTLTKFTALLGLFLPFSLFSQHFVQHQDAAYIDHIFVATSSMGGGAAFFDADNDGDEDLYITSGNARDHFYLNNGDGSFQESGIAAGFEMTDNFYTTGVIAGDIDNDGYKDLFVTTWFSDSLDLDKNLLFKNNGDGTFTEIFEVNVPSDRSQTFGATFIDYDLDGLLDIYAVNYVAEAQLLYDDDGNAIGFDHTCFNNLFYHNLGNGEFEEKAFQLGLQDGGCALAVTASDFDMDADMDIYIANDFGEFIIPNQLYQNDPTTGYFWNVSEPYQANVQMYGMGIAVGDIDGDLDLDYYVTNFGKNAMLRNEGGHFSNITAESQTGDEWVIQDSSMTVGWGTAFMDIDNDTDLDLYVTNGYVPAPDFLPSEIFHNDALFLNDGNAQFENVSDEYGIDNLWVGRGMTYSDYDNDGDLDILSVNHHQPISTTGKQTVLFNNQMGNEKNWVQIQLEGVTVNRDAYGSKIYLYSGDKTWLREVSGGGSHASHISSRAHFGLGDLTEIDSVKILWTGEQNQQTVYDLAINEIHYIQEDTTNITSTHFLDNQSFIPVAIFPNPTSGKLTIQLENTAETMDAIEIYSTIGNRLQQFSEINTAQFEVDLSELGKGVYFVKISVGEEFVIRRVILGE